MMACMYRCSANTNNGLASHRFMPCRVHRCLFCLWVLWSSFAFWQRTWQMKGSFNKADCHEGYRSWKPWACFAGIGCIRSLGGVWLVYTVQFREAAPLLQIIVFAYELETHPLPLAFRISFGAFDYKGANKEGQFRVESLYEDTDFAQQVLHLALRAVWTNAEIGMCRSHEISLRAGPQTCFPDSGLPSRRTVFAG